MSERNSYQIQGEIVLLGPLSHKGESIGTDSYLATRTIVGPDGVPRECFSYAGNAFRGQLRDCGARYLLERLGGIKVPLETFHLIFGGGALGGDQKIDIDQGRRMRSVLPLLSVLGGGVGNQILPGKLRMGDMWPICEETQHMLPKALRDASASSWRKLTFEQTMTRRDDSKDDNQRAYLLEASAPAKLIEAPDGKAVGAKKPKGAKGGDDAPAQQMIYSTEMLAAGSRLYQRIDLVMATEVEVGALVSALHEFSKTPYIGGMSRAGCGLVAGRWTIKRHGVVDGAVGGEEPFITIGVGDYHEGPTATKAREAYDQHLKGLYDAYLQDNKASLVDLLDGKAS